MATFLRAHWEVLAAGDFLSVEVWTGKGLVTHYLMFVINLADRLIDVAGITTNPTEGWMLQVGRNMTDSIDGALLGKRYLILERDTMDRMILVGQGSLRLAVAEYVAHYHGERNHQGMSNRLLMPRECVGTQHGSIRKRDRLGGMLNYYDRRAA